MFVINRAAIILKYKDPAIRWINEADPVHDDPGIGADSVNEERTIHLISDADGDTKETVNGWVNQNYKTLFEEDLEGWYTDSSLWPKKRTLRLFRGWFEVECHTVLIGTVGDVIYDDDI